MAMGVPLVCNSNVGDTDEIVHRYQSGVVISDFSDNAYSAALEQLHGFDATAIANGAQDYFSLEEGVKRYEYIYSNILG